MSQTPQASEQAIRSKARRIVFTLIAVAIPVVLLAALEFGLRGAGVGRDREPLFIPSQDQPELMLANPRVVQRFFTVPEHAPPVSIETRFFACQ